MLSILEIILSPVVWLMKLVLEFYISLVSSTGLSILLLSFTFAVILLPLRRNPGPEAGSTGRAGLLAAGSPVGARRF